MKKRNVLIALGLSTALVMSQGAGVFAADSSTTSGTKASAAGASAEQMLEGRDYVKGQLIVTFKDGTSSSRVKSVIRSRNSSCESIAKVDEQKVAQVVISKDDSMKSAIMKYQSDPRVESVQPNYRYTISSTDGEDPYLNQSNDSSKYQYQLANTKAEAAWSELESSGYSTTKVAVLDTGVDVNHEDLQANLVTDKAGTYMQTVGGEHIEATDDSGNHGTHVTGIIGATYHNGKGGSGVASGHHNDLVDVMMVGTSNDGENVYTLDVVNGIKYAVSKGAKVINMSFGGAGRDRVMEQAIKDAYYNDNVVFVAASGNDDVSTYSDPSDMKEVIAVNASDSINKAAHWSDYGMPKDITAPGNNILSTLPGDEYGLMSGTSMASPVVAGIAALVLDANKNLTPAQVYNIICASTSQSDFDETETAYGIIDAESAVKAAKTASASIPVESLTLKSSGVTVYAGDDSSLEALVRPAASLQQINWSSSDSSVARVDSNGIVTGVTKGTAVVTATAGSKSVQCVVKVKAAVVATAITINDRPIDDELAPGGSAYLSGVMTPTNATNTEVYWTSDNSQVAGINEAGILTAYDYGKAKITARTFDGKVTSSFTLTVKKAVSKVRFTKTYKKIKKGRNYTFKAALYAKDKSTDVANNHIKWKSSNKRIASVDADTGVVKARKPGKFFIIACWSGNTDKKVYTRITVVK